MAGVFTLPRSLPLVQPVHQRLIAPLSKGGGNRDPWMWATGTLNVLGYVQNSRSFNFTDWMWGGGRLNVNGVVDNARAF